MNTLWAILWADNSFAGRWIILTIGVLFLWAWSRGWKGRQGLVADARWLDRAVERLKSETSDLEGVSSRVQPQDLLEKGGERSLIQQRIALISHLANGRMKVHVQTLQRLTREDLAARAELIIPSRIAQTAMILGILGTFWGLAALVQDLRFVLPEGDGWNPQSWRESLDNVTAVMVGIKTAFSTSLVGLAVSLLLTILAGRLEDRRADLIFRLDHFTLHGLIPSLAPEFEDSTMLDQVSRRIEDSFDQLESTVHQNEALVARLSGVHEAYLEIVDQIRSLTRTEAGKSFEDMVEGLAATNAALLSLAETIPKTVDAVASSQERFLARLNPVHQISAGLSNLWTARLPGGIPGSLAILLLLVLFIAFGVDWYF